MASSTLVTAGSSDVTYKTIVGLVAIPLFLCSCGGNPTTPFERRVDERSGESFTQSSEPLRLVATRPALSRVGKDYLFLAPVLVSGSREPQKYLWFSFGSSIDRRITGAEQPVVNSIVLVLDGTPMTFDLLPWPEIASSRPFETSVKHHASFGARVTTSQLQRLSAARELAAFVTNNDHRSPKYVLVAGEYGAWSDF